MDLRVNMEKKSIFFIISILLLSISQIVYSLEKPSTGSIENFLSVLSPSTSQNSQKIISDEISLSEDKLDQKIKIYKQGNLDYTIKNLYKVNENFNINDTKLFWALDLRKDSNNYAEAYYQINATVVAISQYSYIFVETASAPFYSGENGQGESIASSFDQIYLKEVLFFGNPSDVDENGKIIILILNILNDGNNVAGFFSPLNWFPISENSEEIDFYSNYADMIYIEKDFVLSSGLATLAHEFQHLIQFNTDDSEDIWLDEGLSMYAEKLTGHDGTINDYVKNVAEGFGNNIDLSLTYWEYSEIAHYGASYLFLLYLSDRFGKNIISQISRDINNQGMESIEKNLKSINTGINISDIFQDWSISLAINDKQSSPYFFNNYSSQVNIQSNWNLNEENEYFGQKVDHWATDIIDLSSTPEGRYWITFRGEISKWEDEFEREFSLTLLQYDSMNSSWLISKLRNFNSILLEMNSNYTTTLLLINSITGTSSGYYEAELPKTWYSNYNLYGQKQITNLPLITGEVKDSFTSRIIIPMPKNLNGTNWSIPLLTEILLQVHDTKTGNIITSFDTFNWNNSEEYFFLDLGNSLFSAGDYFFSAKLTTLGEEITLFSKGWTELGQFISNNSISSSNDYNDTSTVASSAYGFTLMSLFILLCIIYMKRKRKF
ncbi:MAG: Neutral metalloprotease precursor [Candidatus Heimdallarchaeota archaeon LC_3]|nr:MAG: Neutral metalloprotease precursor [Candidatus Heimdallarchaeota archaeon LC_3]